MVMKKKLEAELISIAHRILKMKNKSDLAQLHQEAQRLYEQLSVLRFVEEHFADARPTIGHAEVEERLSLTFDTLQDAPEQADKTQAIGGIVSDLSQNASRQTDEVEQAAQADAPQTQPEPVAGLESPEEQVAPVEARATEDAQDDKEQQENEPEPAPEPEPTPVEEPAEEEKPKEIAAEAPAASSFKPAFELSFDPKDETAEEKPGAPKITPAQISFDDLLGQDYVDPVFVKPEEVETPMGATQSSAQDLRAAELAESNRRLAELRDASQNVIQPRELKPEIKPDVIPISRTFSDTANVIPIHKETLNDRVSKGITIGLNDRIAFMKHLFNNSSEDYNRVLSQLITIDTLTEAKNFIDNIVKPDYNNWEGKEEYEQRFMEIVEKKFA